MKTIRLHLQDPYWNLAFEEYMLKDAFIEEDLFYVWKNSSCIVLGRNQNPYREVALLEASKSHIPVIRRISGGGCVFHDEGNLNFTFVTNDYKGKINQYALFLHYVISALNYMGIQATFHGKSDIYIGDTKISGNAQSFHKNRLIHHGTLLFDADLMGLNRYLHGSIPSTVGPLVESNRSKVGNIANYIPVKMTMDEFEKVFLDAFQMANQLVLEEHELTSSEFDRITLLADSKYRSFEWNYGETPPFSKHIFDEENQLIAVMDIHHANIERVTMSNPNSSINLGFLENQRFEIETIKRLLVESRIKDPSKWLERIFR
jgi:lipoate---protein ligase